MSAEEILFHIRNPQVFTGREINAVRQPFTADRLHICLVFPDTYEIGMSHFGLKILYHLLNSIPAVNAERCFLPDQESLIEFRRRRQPLFSLENRQPLGRFDMVGFSLLSELNATNVLQVLEAADIPVRSSDRLDSDPLIGAGGIVAANPEPLRDFVDFFAFGDGEILFRDIVAVLAAGKKTGASRGQVLAELDRHPSIYVPARHALRPDGRFFVPETPPKIKAALSSLQDSHWESREIVPITNVVFNRLNVEIARGCPQRCRFCQARHYYAPFRCRSSQSCLAFISSALQQTGLETFSLSALSAGDYPHIRELLRAIPQVVPEGRSFSVPSLRPATLTDDLLATISSFRRTGITVVPEAGSERLRRVLNKNVRDEDIFSALDLAVRHGWRKIKLYFMIGLPGETDADIESLVGLIDRIVAALPRRPRFDIHASFSNFVPKPHTPLQWAGREPLGRLEEKIRFLKERLRHHRALIADFHSPQRGMVETVLARGDQRVGRLLEEVFRQGEIFTAWEGGFHYPPWEEAISRLGLTGLLTEIPTDVPLPWDFLTLDFSRDHLLAEYRLALAGEPSPACAEKNCRECKGCLHLFAERSPEGAARQPQVQSPQVKENKSAFPLPEAFDRLRLFYKKTGAFRFFSHLGLMQYIEQLLRRSGLRFKHTQGFHQRLKMSGLPPLPVYAQGDREVVEVYVETGLDAEQVRRAIAATAADFPFTEVRICSHPAPLSKDIATLTYEFAGPLGPQVRTAIEPLRGPADTLTYASDKLTLQIAFGDNGAQRFARIYRLIDPERTLTRHLTRTGVTFKHER